MNPDEMERKAIEDEAQDEQATNEGMPEAPYVDPSVEIPEGEDTPSRPKIVLGLHQLGITVTVNPADGSPSATVILNPDEGFLNAGHLQSLATFFMHMGIQQQMMQRAEIEQMMAATAAPNKKTKGGVYLR